MQVVESPFKTTKERKRESDARRKETAARRQSRDKYHATRERETRISSEEYLSRPFIAYDGEGADIDGVHCYVMISALRPDGYARTLVRERGISTMEALEFLTSFAGECEPKAIHAIYGGGYDVNMILRDVPRPLIRDLYDGRMIQYGPYEMAWRTGKTFWVRIYGAERGFTLYDVVSFFQAPFIAACDSYLGSAFWERDLIVKNKAKRSQFRMEDIEEIKRYTHAELVNLIALMNSLRERLDRVGLRPKRWDGPGAIAATLLAKYGVRDAIGEVPEEVATAARYAYAGGRFEVIQFGRFDMPVYEYDLNAAYPAAMGDLPDLMRGTWVHAKGDAGRKRFALYRITYRIGNWKIPSALFCRGENGTVFYPGVVNGWYWSPEIDAVRDLAEETGATYTIHETWYFDEEDSERRPFRFVAELYEERRRLKAAGDGAHVGLKLGLNSLYGKLAQQVGAKYNKRTKEWRLPPYHCLEWAGYITSFCRARVYRAAMQAPECIIAFETDALFTTAKLEIDETEGKLGAFERVDFTNLTYTQSGLYFGDHPNGKTTSKTRGVDRGELKREEVERAMLQPKAKLRKVPAKLTRFITAGIALSQNWTKWRSWNVMTKGITCEPTGKRVHFFMRNNCKCFVPWLTKGEYSLGPHVTFCPFLGNNVSHQFPVLWINPDPKMDKLAELREEDRAVTGSE